MGDDASGEGDVGLLYGCEEDEEDDGPALCRSGVAERTGEGRGRNVVEGEEGPDTAPESAAAEATRPHKTHPACDGDIGGDPLEYEFWREGVFGSNGECEEDECGCTWRR